MSIFILNESDFCLPSGRVGGEQKTPLATMSASALEIPFTPQLKIEDDAFDLLAVIMMNSVPLQRIYAVPVYDNGFSAIAPQRLSRQPNRPGGTALSLPEALFRKVVLTLNYERKNIPPSTKLLEIRDITLASGLFACLFHKLEYHRPPINRIPYYSSFWMNTAR